ncbi:MAG: RNA methyltransferase [Candidatus Cloacimonetes bacterium]|nr:RNA methyltransferase [Candidatus Cloacimonadota bacterium]
MKTITALHKNLCIILVEPIYKGNIGAVSRIMKNFGFSNLRIVGKIPVREDFALAVHSQDILDTIQTFENLEAALSDLDGAVAITRRKARRKSFDFKPSGFADYVCSNSHSKLGIVFGRETYGLTKEEEDLCSMRCHIPSNPEFPSLNLSHSVAIIMYEIFKQSELFAQPLNRKDKLVSNSEINETVDYIIEMLRRIGFFNRSNDHQIHFLFRNILMKANLGKISNHKIKKVFERIWALFKQQEKSNTINSDVG